MIFVPSGNFSEVDIVPADGGFVPTLGGMIPGESAGADCTCPFAGVGAYATIKRPTSIQHWACVDPGLPEPDYFFNYQESSGSLVDSVMGMSLAPLASPTYQQSVTDWTTKWIGLTQVQNQGFQAAAGVGWNVATQSVFALCYGALTSVTANTRVWQILGGTSPSSVFNSFNTTGFTVLHRAGVSTVGTFNYISATPAPRPFATSWDVRGSGLYRLHTDKEQISVAWAQHPDGLKGPSAAFNTFTPAMLLNFWAIWVGAKAEYCIDLGGAGLGGKTLISRLGWTLAY